MGIRVVRDRVISIPTYRPDWNLAALRHIQLLDPENHHLVSDQFLEELFPEDRNRRDNW